MKDSTREFILKFFFFPQRYVLALIGCCGVIQSYSLRIVFNVALTVMAPIHTNVTINDPNACKEEGSEFSPSVGISVRDEVYDWSAETQGFFGTIFYAGYMVGHLPAMFFSKRFGGKHFLGLGIFLGAIITVGTPLIVTWTKGNWVVMSATRFIAGFGIGGTYPSLNEILAHWIPLTERSTISTLTYSGCILGTIMASSLTGVIIAHTGQWSSAFYVFGWIAVAWCLLWTLLCYSEPNTHPFISEKERVLLVELIGASTNTKRRIPWLKIATNRAVLACVVMQAGYDWVLYTMITDLPKYMKFVLRFNIENSGVWSAVPYIAMWFVAVSSGVVADVLITKKYCSILFVRRLFTSFCKVLSVTFLVAASYSGCQKTLVVAMFTLAVGTLGFFYSGGKVNILDISVNYAGTLMAIINGVGCLTGITVPYLDGVVARDQTLVQWRTIIWICFAVSTISNVIFVVFASDKRQPFDYVDDEENAADPGATAKV